MTMPYEASFFADQFALNRRSCEAALYRHSKADLDMHHRSIHSDPGVRFDLIKLHQLETSIWKKQLLKHLGIYPNLNNEGLALRLGEGSGRKQSFTGIGYFESGQVDVVSSACKYYPTHQRLVGMDAAESSFSTDLLRYRNMSKVWALNPLVVDSKNCHQGRVVSTSLSSSATSLYSEEDFTRYSQNTSPVPSVVSECPSLSRHISQSNCDKDTEEVQELLKEMLLIEEQNITNNNAKSIKTTDDNDYSMQGAKNELFHSCESLDAKSISSVLSTVEENVEDIFEKKVGNT